MNWHLLLRFLHIGSAILFVGGIIARQVVRALAEKAGDVQTFAVLNRAAGRIENAMIIPGNLAVIVFGVILALLTGAPILGFLQGATRNWLLVSVILLVIGFASVPLVFIPRGKQFEVVLQRALKQGEMTPELRAAFHDKVIQRMHMVEMLLVAAVFFLMVFKPF